MQQNVAKKAFYALWDRRSSINLLGNTIDIQTGVGSSTLFFSFHRPS
jgi:hypothetical protein